jgi:hypothetical protein
MGYMGLDHYNSSDMASDLAYVMQNAMAETLRKGLKEKGNQYNTDGVVNVAMIFRDLIIPHLEEYCGNDKLQEVAKITHDKLAEQIGNDEPDDWGTSKEDKANRKMHIDAYKKMLRALEKFVGEAY